jgi:signal transduction histidine kinase
MAARALGIGGDLRVESEPGIGTRIIVNMPRAAEDTRQ